MKIKSPVTYSFNTSLITQFDVAVIIQQYKAETNVDVSRFFQGLKKIDLYQCKDSGYRFYNPSDIWGDGKFYEDLQNNNSWYYAADRWEHKQALSLISTDEKVLEIGCGDGVFLQMLKKKGLKAIEAIELNEKAAATVNNSGFQVKVETIESYAVKNIERYDVVCAFQVLEHIYDVKSFLDASLLTLKKGGRMIIAVPNNNPYMHRHDINHTLNLPPHHAGLWNKKSFESLEKFYPVKLINVNIRALISNRTWRSVQKKYYRKNSAWKSFFFSIVPSFVFKFYFSIFKQPGRDILVEFVKI